MHDKKILNTQISDAMKNIIFNRKSECELSDPIPSIIWGRCWNEDEENYYLNLYERKQIPISDPIRFVDIDGIEFLIIQDWLCEDFEGKIIDIVEGQLTVIDNSDE